MTDPLVSILMTAYNREQYIAESIESVINSVYTNWELIITDNCSADKTVEIAQGYAARDARIRVYRNKTNIGQFPNRNYAASLANGSYIKYLDSDDMIYPFGLSILVKRAMQFSDAGLVMSTPVLGELIPYPEYLTPVEAYRKYFLVGGFPSVGPSFTLIRTDVFHAVKGFTVPGYAGTDTEFLLQVAARYPVVKAENGTIWYRQHPGQEIQQAYKNFEYELQEYNVFLKLLESPDCPLNSIEKAQSLDQLKKRNLRRLMRFAAKFRFDLSSKIYHEVQPSMADFIKAMKN